MIMSITKMFALHHYSPTLFKNFNFNLAFCSKIDQLASSPSKSSLCYRGFSGAPASSKIPFRVIHSINGRTSHPKRSRNTVALNLCGSQSDLHSYGRRALASQTYYPSDPKATFSSSPQQPKLAHEWIVDGKVQSTVGESVLEEKSVVVFLHGLLGNAKNLRTPAKKLTQLLPNTSALLLDIRGHGNSTASGAYSDNLQFSPPHNFESCSQDIVDTLLPLGLVGHRSPTAVVGHSLGGRLALQYSHHVSSTRSSESTSLLHPPSQTWILDAVPGQPDPSVHNVLRTISSIPLPIHSKSWLTEVLVEEHGMNKGVAMWMASNLREMEEMSAIENSTKKQKPLEWIFDLDVANELVHNFSKQNFVGMIDEIAARDSKVHLVMAGKNKEWREEVVNELQSLPSYQPSSSSMFRMHKLQKAGHWVHVDDLEGLLELMVQEMSTL